MIVGRRALLAGAACAFCVGHPALALPIPPTGSLSFRVMRKGDAIGTHQLSFARDGASLTVVTIQVEISVSLGPIRLFHYTHHNIERWQDDRLIGFEARTDDDGTLHWATADRRSGLLMVKGSKATSYTAPDGTLAATHWNRRQLDGPMINTQDGRLLHPMVTPSGPARVPLASGEQVRATGYALTGDVTLDLWYAADTAWTALSFTAGDGSAVTYQRL